MGRFFRRFFVGLLFCSAFFAGAYAPFPAWAAEDEVSAEDGAVQESRSLHQLSDEQVKRLATLVRLLEPREFTVAAEALRYENVKISALTKTSATYRFMRALTEYGLAKQNPLPPMPGVPAQVQESMSTFSYKPDAHEVIADILKTGRPDKASMVDSYIASEQ